MRIVRRWTRLLGFAGLVACAPRPSAAQAPKGSATLSPAAVADSLSVLEDLDSLLHKNRDDAKLWYHRGMVAWALAERDQHKPSVKGLDHTLLGRMADTSLRIAADIDRTNPIYRLAVGRYLLATGTSISRMASYGEFDKALEIARKSEDPYVHSEAAVEAGRVAWRRYDALADRWNPLQPDIACEPLTGAIGRAEAEKMISDLKGCAMRIDDPPSGDDDYIKAGDLFQEAFDINPSNQRAYRQLAMLLVERNRWTELAAMARTRITAASWDAWAWLTLALALHRQQSPVASVVAAFDSAFTLLPYDDVRWFMRFERVLRPDDTLKVQSADPSMRFAYHRLFWLTANPLWSRDVAQPQLDFLARVVYAELRWTVEELNVRGAETDRGDVYVRYGAPDVKFGRRADIETVNSVATTWIYARGLVFSFVGQPTFATAHVAAADQGLFGDAIKSTPVLWPTAAGFVMDSMETQLVRFRAPRDSVDVFFAALPPVGSIVKGAEVVSRVGLRYWLLAGGVVTAATDSATLLTDEIKTFTHRVAPHAYAFRAEASTDASLHAARATAAFGADSANGFPSHGFGMSDVLVATKLVEPRDPPVRWTDFTITPAVGAVAKGASIQLLWENYELAQKDNAVAYDVMIRLDRADQSTAGKLAAQITGRLASSVGVDRADDHLTFRYERKLPYRTLMLDNMSLGLGETPAGAYKLTVEIHDSISGKTVSRAMSLVVR